MNGVACSDSVAALGQSHQRQMPVGSPKDQPTLVVLVSLKNTGVAQLHQRPMRGRR